MPTPIDSATRSLLQVALGFIGAALIVPLLLKTVVGLVKGVFRFSTTRRIVGELALAGLLGLLANENVLNRLFGSKGNVGDGLLKPKNGDMGAR